MKLLLLVGSALPMLRLALILALALFAGLAAAQTPPVKFTRLTSSHGLSQNTVYQILQDRQGYMWLATGDGLNRYDGVDVRVFRNHPDDPASIDDNYVSALAEDRDGTLWVGLIGAGLDHFDPKTGRFEHAHHDPADASSLPHEGVTALLVDRDGALWVGTSGGLAVRDAGSGRFTRVPMRAAAEAGRGEPAVRALYQRADGDILVGTAGDGVHVFQRAHDRVAKLPVAPADVGLRGGDLSINGFLEDTAGTVWVATANAGLVRLRVADGAVEARRYNPDPAIPGGSPVIEITALLSGGEGRLWVGTWGGGLASFEPETGRFDALRASLADPHSLSSNIVQSLFRDAAGMVWVGTFDRGVNWFSERAPFEHHYRDPLREPTLPDNTVWAFAEGDDGDVWVGTAGGLGRLSMARRRFVPLAERADAVPPALRGDVRAVVAHDGALWIGTWGKGLLRWDPRSGEWASFTADANDPQSLSDNRVRLILPDPDGALWVGTQNGLNRLDPANGRFRRFHHDAADPRSLPHARIRALHVDRAGVLWVGTSGGLARLDPDGTFTNWLRRTGDPNALQDGDVRAIHEAGDGTLWLATGGGLTRFEPDRGPTRTYDERDGLLNSTLYGILPDGDGQLWISTNRGLARFDPKAGRFRVWLAPDGLQDNEFNFGAWARTRDGLFLFGGINGFNLFDPRTVLTPPPPSAAPPLVVEDIAVASDAGTRLADGTGGLALGHADHALSIRFAALQYDQPEGTRYATWMEGLEKGWGPLAAGVRQARYAELPAGRFVFHARAVTARGVPARNEITVPITVKPAPWRTMWAFALYALALVLAGIGGAAVRHRALARRAMWLQEEVARQTQALAASAATIEQKNAALQELLNVRSGLYRALSHELRTPLSVVLSALQDLSGRLAGSSRETVDIVLGSARRLSRLVEQLLLLARIDGPPTAASNGGAAFVGAAVRELLPAFGLLASTRGLTLEHRIDDQACGVVTSEAVELIAQNLLSNAIKYSPAGGAVRVAVEGGVDEVRLIVSDTGMGIPASQQQAIFQPFYRVPDPDVQREMGAGIGLALVRDLVHRHGGRIDVQSAPGRGATFTVRFRAARPHDTPCSAPAVAAATMPQAPPPHGGQPAAERSAGSDGPMLLIIDDDPDLRGWLPRLFADDYACHVAATAEEGLDLARELVPDCILCDVMLPSKSGFDVAEAVRSDPRICHVPLVLLTALGDDDSRLAGLDREIDDYVTKPFNNQELRLRVRNLLANRRRVAEEMRQRLQVAPAPPEAEPAGDPCPLPIRDQQFLARVDAVLLERLGDASVGLLEIARSCGLSERQFQRKLSALTGSSFSEYRTALRMREARALLATDRTLTDIAHTLGYSSSAYFSKAFKDIHGVPPGDWRRHGGTRPTSADGSTENAAMEP
ncbi:hybrid sensor histidine kinase/response regulator transcription factor [Azospirillum sp.]|uniref:hybrid sensor histidine kinase/response regulator transcription factor n=1 Tax=Azospirillum sp. TaxID=34012 RepID=UPI002D483B1E|nr:two-component regulator propeller domain-containing protein [Azospirillum sp.]HYD70233.1 two-component regulator propeller domain-containing protein [Azospirillum sp.]